MPARDPYAVALTASLFGQWTLVHAAGKPGWLPSSKLLAESGLSAFQEIFFWIAIFTLPLLLLISRLPSRETEEAEREAIYAVSQPIAEN